MINRNSISSSGLFLIELLICLMIFAVASAICLKVFVGSHLISEESNKVNNAVIAAQNGAEAFKATGGDLIAAAKLLEESVLDGDSIIRLYDNNWNPVAFRFGSETVYAGYVLEVRRFSEGNGYIGGEAAVSDTSGNLIFSVPVAAWEVAR